MKEAVLKVYELQKIGSQGSRELAKKKFQTVRDRLEIDGEELLLTGTQFIDIAMGAIELGLQIQMITGDFYCGWENQEHQLTRALSVRIDDRTHNLCPTHPLEEVLTPHENIVRLRQSLDG